MKKGRKGVEKKGSGNGEGEYPGGGSEGEMAGRRGDGLNWPLIRAAEKMPREEGILTSTHTVLPSDAAFNTRSGS